MQNRYKKKIQNRYKQKLNRYKTNTRDTDNETDTKQIQNRYKKLIKKIQDTPTNQQIIRYKQHKYKTKLFGVHKHGRLFRSQKLFGFGNFPTLNLEVRERVPKGVCGLQRAFISQTPV